MSATVVIVGSSIGGVRTAQALRSADYDGDIVLIGDENVLPYDKPPLSKAFLASMATVDDIALLTEATAAEAGIKLLLGHSARRLDVAGRTVELGSGRRIAYDHLVIATGARAKSPPWSGGRGVHLLRTLADATALRDRLGRGGPVVVVGGGFIGSEVAATARQLGAEVVVVDPLPVPLSRVLGAEAGKWFVELHQSHGVETRFGIGAERVTHREDGLAVHLVDGEILYATTVVVGIGTVPNDDWLSSSGLLIDSGVVCDEFGRAVGAPRIHAVGDVARWFDPCRGAHVRSEHWTSAVEQANCVGHNIANPDEPHALANQEYVWSDQFDWTLQLIGHTAGFQDEVVVGTVGTGAKMPPKAAVLYSEDGQRICGAATVNWPRAMSDCRRAVGARAHLQAIKAQLVARS